MEFFLSAAFVFGLVVFVLASGLLVRNEQVFAFRQGLLDQMITSLGGEDNDPVVREQLDAYLTVDYTTMLYKFWKPLNVRTWYAGTALDR